MELLWLLDGRECRGLRLDLECMDLTLTCYVAISNRAMEYQIPK